MRTMNPLELVWGPASSACAAASAGAGAWLAMASQAALELFGVPLPVVLAALTGACGARVFLEPTTFWRAVSASLFWTIAGSIGAQLVLWLVGLWAGGTAPGGVLAGVALASAALGQRVAPIIWQSGGAALQRKLDSLFNSKPKGEQ